MKDKLSLIDSKLPRAHFIGIAGAGMRALATVLAQRGWAISGSDLQPSAADGLQQLGVRVFQGHTSGNVPANADVVAYSEAVPTSNPERLRATELGIQTVSYAQLLGMISGVESTEGRQTARQRLLAIAGTHGKSTVTAMTAQILVLAGLDPTVVCGAAPVQAGNGGIGEAGGRHGNGAFSLVEACEYRGNFLHLQPDVAVLLNIEHDHFDCYSMLNDVATAFANFLQRLPSDGLVIAAHEDSISRCSLPRTVAEASGRRTVTFGLSKNADWQATNLQQSRGRYRFDLVRHNRRFIHVVLAAPGKHNVLNALAAAALARHCGVSAQHIAQGLAAFRGLKRRLEPRGTWGGVPWIDDYAHHPTEIKASLAALRQMYPRRRICCVFQPHQACRLTALLDELADSLHNADRIAVADVFRAREPAAQKGEASASDLTEQLQADGIDIIEEHHPQAIARRLANDLQPGDLLVTLGAGDLGKTFNEFRERLRRNCAVA